MKFKNRFSGERLDNKSFVFKGKKLALSSPPPYADAGIEFNFELTSSKFLVKAVSIIESGTLFGISAGQLPVFL